MPEALIANLLGMRYASISLVVNRAAGMGTVKEMEEDEMRKIREQEMATLVQALGMFPDF